MQLPFQVLLPQLSPACSGFPSGTRKEILSESCYIKPKSDCIYHFPIALEPHEKTFPGILFEKFEPMLTINCLRLSTICLSSDNDILTDNR